ncbi:MAG: elongation factor P [Planctomycetes bacterium]|nr:elongation factor P [Planctomycetota bacterium]
MAEYSTSDFRKGIRVELDGEPYLVTESEFMKPGKGQAVYRIKCKNLIRGNVLDRTYRSGDKIKAADIEEHTLQYLYNDSASWHFMHPETFEQYSLEKGNLGDAWKWLIDGMNVAVVFWNGHPLTVTPPNHVELKIVYCEPAAKGNTATNVQKPVKLETGVEIFVPAFINNGDIVKVDTRTGEYIERVKKA